MPQRFRYQAPDNPYQRYINFAASLGITPTLIPPFGREVTENDLFFRPPPPLYPLVAQDTPPGYISRRNSTVPSEAPPDYSSRRASDASFISNDIPRRPSSAPSEGSVSRAGRASSVVSDTEISEDVDRIGWQVDRRPRDAAGFLLTGPVPPGVAGNTQSAAGTHEAEEEEEQTRLRRQQHARAAEMFRLYSPPESSVITSDSLHISESGSSSRAVPATELVHPVPRSPNPPAFRLDIFNNTLPSRLVESPNISPRTSVVWNIPEAAGTQRRPTDDLARLRNLGRRMAVVESRRSSRSSVYTEQGRSESDSVYGQQRRSSTPVGPSDPRVYEIDHSRLWEDEDDEEGEAGSTTSGPRSGTSARDGNRLDTVAEEAIQSVEDARVEEVPAPRPQLTGSNDVISEIVTENVNRQQQSNQPQVIRIPEAAVLRQHASRGIVFEVKYGDMVLEVPWGSDTRIISVQPPGQSMVVQRSGLNDVDLESGMGSRSRSRGPRSRRTDDDDEEESMCASHCAIM
ncbi:hypothetical protein BZA77DRAFT_295246 [Pyronema omphalodes]|nr:hypothetical protein BZA77DRAFT_295246 [Pyronema omphalodes]